MTSGSIGRRGTPDEGLRELRVGGPATAAMPVNCPGPGPRTTRASPRRTAARRSRLTLWTGVRVRDRGR